MIFICHPIYVKYIKLPSSYFNVPNPTINLKAKMCDKQIKVAKKLVYQLRNTHNPTFFPTKKKKILNFYLLILIVNMIDPPSHA